MERIAVGVVLSLLILGIVGCGGDNPVGTKDPPAMIEAGLSGDTYMNTKFGLKITNLPVDEWTIKDYGANGQGMMKPAKPGIMPHYILLVMEPVVADKFVDLDAGSNTNPIFVSDISFIIITVDYEEGRFETYNLTEELNRHAENYDFEIESKEHILAGNTSGIQVVMSDLIYRRAEAWFAKTDMLIRCQYHPSLSEFDKHFSVFDQIVENMSLIGQ